MVAYVYWGCGVSAFSLNLQMDEGSMTALQKQMQRRVSELGDTPETAIRVGFIAAMRSMQASTKVAPRRRKVRQPSRESNGRGVRSKGNRLFIAEGIDRNNGGVPKNILIWAPNLAIAKLSPKAQIKKWGLAKTSWGWAMQRLFGGQAQGARGGLAQPSGTLAVTKIIDRATGYAEAGVNNKLDYIAHALSGGRGPAVSTALSRAAGAMKGRIDQAVKKATSEAGY
jgi:hypothetical protein